MLNHLIMPIAFFLMAIGLSLITIGLQKDNWFGEPTPEGRQIATEGAAYVLASICMMMFAL